MSQLDLEQLEQEGEEHLAENQPAPGKATLTSRIGKAHRAGAGDLIDGATHAHLAGGLGVELSRGDGGNGGAGTPRSKNGLGLGFLGGHGAELGGDVAGDVDEEKKPGRGLDYLAKQQREVRQFDSVGDFYDERATVDPSVAKQAMVGAVGDIAKTPTPAGPVPIPYPDAGPTPGADLKSQQREVTQFDSAGDFYDERATVDPSVAKQAMVGSVADVAKTPTPAGPVPIPYPNAGPTPGADLKSQQREVTQFDSVGDFYDERATVDPTAAKQAMPEAVAAVAKTPTPAGPVPIPYPNAGPTPGADLKSQQREVTQFDSKGDFYDERATVDPSAAKQAMPGAVADVAKTPTPAGPVPIPYPNAGPTPGADLKSQQREVTQFDSKGDFYDQRATVEPTGTLSVGGTTYETDKNNAAAVFGGAADTAGAAVAAGVAGAANATSAAGAAGAAGVAAAEQAAAAVVNAPDPAAEAAKSAQEIEAQRVHEAMHAAAGTAGGAIDAAQAAGVAAQQKTKTGATAGATAGTDAVGMINPDLKKPAKPGDVPLDATNPDLEKKTPGPHGEVPLDAIKPDLEKQKPPHDDVPLDAINPDLKKKTPGDGILDPHEDEPLFDASEFENFPGDAELHKGGKSLDPDAKDPHFDGKVDQAKVDPAKTKQILKDVQQDATVKKGTIKQGVEVKSAAAHKAAMKSAAGAAAKGGKKVATAGAKGAGMVGKKKADVQVKKIEKAKNIEELKARLDKGLNDQKTALTEQFKKQREDLAKKLEAEKKKIDDEMKTQADKLAKELTAKTADIDKKILEKKKAYDKQIADDKKAAEKTCKDEQRKTRETTTKEVQKIQKAGDAEAGKVTKQGHTDAAAARQRGQSKANAALAGANKRAEGIEDANQKNAAQQAGQAQAARARSAANAEAAQIEGAAKAEAAKRKELTATLVAEAKAKGEKAIQDLDAKLKASIADIEKKAADGVAKMEAEKAKLVKEVKDFETTTKARHATDNEAAKKKIAVLEAEQKQKIIAAEEPALKALTAKRDEMMMKLEKGTAADLEKLEKETNESVAGIEQQVKATGMKIDAEIKAVQDKAAFEAKKRTDAIAADGTKQIGELDKKVKDVETKLEAIDKENKNALAKAAADTKQGLEAQGQKDRDAIIAGADKAVVDLAKTSDKYEEDKRAEADAAAKKKAQEEADKRAAEEKAAADEKQKVKEAEEAKKKEWEAFQKTTNDAAADLFKAMDDQWGTDEALVMKTLKGKSPKELEAIKKAYFDRTGRSLEAALADEMSGTDLKEAKSMLTADPVQQAVAQLQSSTDSWFSTDRDKIKSTLDEIKDPEVRKKVIAEYEKATGKRLHKMLEEEGMAKQDVNTADYKAAEEPAGPQRKLSPEEEQKAFAAVSELEGAMHRYGTDEAKIFAALKGKSPEEIAFIKKAYKDKHKKDLDDVLEDELSGTDLKEAKGLMSADPVRIAVAQLHNASDGLGTDKDKLLGALKDIKDPEIRKQVAAEYEKSTGENLQAMIKDEMSGMDGDLATELAGDKEGKVNQGAVAAIEADKAMHGGFLTDISDGMADSFGVDRDEMRKAVGNSIFPGLGDKLGTDIGGTDEEALYKALESCKDQAERDEMVRQYEKRTKRTLAADLKSELKPKEMDVTDALLAGKKNEAEAAKMAAAADGAGTDRKALYAALEGKSLDERREIIKAFNAKYGSEYPEVEIEVVDPKDPTKKIKKKVSGFEAMCADELDDLDRQKAEQIAANGKMDDGFALYYAMNEGFMGIGTDDDALKEKLKGKSKEEIEAMQKAYIRAKCMQEGRPIPADLDSWKFGDKRLGELNADVEGETSGRVGHELKQGMKGNPTTVQEMLDRAKEDYDFERHDSGWMGEVGVLLLAGPVAYGQMKAAGKTPADISNAITDSWSDSGKQLDADYKALVERANKLKSDAEKDPKYAGMKPEDRQKAIDKDVMDALKSEGKTAYLEGSIKQFGEAKDATADMAGTVVAVAVGAIITIASGGTAAPALVALISGLAGVSAKMIIAGASMSNEKLVQELAQVAAEALAAGLVNTEFMETAIKNVAGKFGNGIAAKIIQEALEEAIESGTEEAILALLDENLYKGDLADFAAGVGGRVGKAALTGAGAAVVSTSFGQLMPGMKKLEGWKPDKAPHGKAISGAINQAVGAAFTTAIDPNTYSGSGADVALAFGKSMGSAAMRGLQDGYSTSDGGFKPGEGWTAKSKTSSNGPNHSQASTETSGKKSSQGGDADVVVNTEVDVNKGKDSVTVTAKADTSVTTNTGTDSASDQVTKTLPLGDNKADPNAKVDPSQVKIDPNAKVDPNGKTQPIDADSLADKDPNSKGTTTTDGKKGSDPDSNVELDPSAKTQADVDAAHKAAAGNNIEALDAAVKALPAASNLEVVADSHQGELASNQITASDAKKLIVMIDAALKTDVGKDAVKALQDLGITLTMRTGDEGGSWRQGNVINIDPTMASDPNELAGILAHEVHHAKTFDQSVDINSERGQYVEQTLRNEAEAQAQLFEHYQQTGSTEGAKNQFGSQQYFAAYNKAAEDFKKANPNATDAQVHAAAKEAGTKALEGVFGNATPSTSVDKQGKLIPGKPKNYAELYGQFHDEHSPQGKLAKEGQKVDPNAAAPQVTPVENSPPPTDRESLRQFINEKFGHIVDKYIGAPHTASTEFNGLIEELSKLEPGELGKPENKAKSKEFLDRWMAIAAQIEAKTGKSEADLRELYNIIEKTQMPVWIEAMKGKSAKEQAELISKMREELKLYIRDLMTDENSKKMLYLRDLALYGDQRGPQMDKLLRDAMKKTGGDEEAAYKLIVESAMRSNKDVNKGLTGNESGIKDGTDTKGDSKKDAEVKPVVPMPAKKGDAEDHGGRGIWNADQAAIDAAMKSKQNPNGLTAAEAADLVALQSKPLTNKADLDRLVELRKKVDAEGKGLPGSPEHMQKAWETSPSDMKKADKFAEWAAQYPNWMSNNVDGPAAEQRYKDKLKAAGIEAKGSVKKTKMDLDGDGTAEEVVRQVDIEVAQKKGPPVLVQIKAGHEALGTVDKQSGGKRKGESSHGNQDALDIDQQLVDEGQASRVVWVLEQIPTAPLMIELASKAPDIETVIRVDKKGDQGEARVRELLELEFKKRLNKDNDGSKTPAEIQAEAEQLAQGVMDKLDIFAGTTAQVVKMVTDGLKEGAKKIPPKGPPQPGPVKKTQSEQNEDAVKASESQRKAERDQLGVSGDGEGFRDKGKHSGTEVHSHFLGIVENKVFADKFGNFQNVLDAIAKLQAKEDAKAAEADAKAAAEGKKATGDSTRDMSHGLHGTGSIKHRGPAGDALLLAQKVNQQLANETHPDIVALKQKMAGDPNLSEEVAKLKEQIAEDTCNLCLAASDQTDFNSSYEIRDALLKQNFAGERKAGESDNDYENRAYREFAKATVARLIEDGILLTEQSNSIKKLQQRFPEGLITWAIKAAINDIAKDDPERAKQLTKDFDVKFLSMGLNRFYGEQDRRWERTLSADEEAKLVDDKGQPLKGAERDAAKRKMEQAASQKAWLSELVNQFGYDRALAVVKAELARIEADLAADPSAKNLDGRNAIHRAEDLRGYIAELGVREGEFRKLAEKLKNQTKIDPNTGLPIEGQGQDASVMRSDIVGIDTAGQELYEFSPEGKERFKLMYLALVEAAKAKGEVLVFRPHVGEGAINPHKGAQWNAMNNRWEGADGKPIHYERAANNVEAMVDVLMELKAQGLLDPTYVTIRFGHATHTSPRDAERLASLAKDGVNVIAEVNLGSNRATNVVDHATTDPNNPDQKMAKAEEDFQDHSFLTLLYNQVQIILSTDGHAVEKTSMGQEYNRAYTIIEKFLKGEMTLRLTADQANGRGREVSPGVWELSFRDLNGDELQRFIKGYRQLHQWANDYRNGPNRGGAKVEGDAKSAAPLPGETIETGASGMVPNSTYSGSAVATDNSAAVTAAVVQAMPKIDDHFSNDTVHVTGPSTLRIEVAGQVYPIQIVVVPNTQLAKPTDVANLDISSNPIIIKVSGNTSGNHVERALTHEVAEIISRLDERHGGKSRPERDALSHDSPQKVLSHDDMGRIAELRVLMAELNRPGADQDALKKEIRALLTHMGLLRDGGTTLRNDGPAMQRRALIEGEADGISLEGVANAIALNPPALPQASNDGLPLRGQHADPSAVPRKNVTYDEVAAAVPPELIAALEKFGLTRDIVIKYVMQCHNDRSRQRYLPDLEGLVRKYAGQNMSASDVWVIDLYTTKLFYELLNKRQRDSTDLDTVEDLQKMLNEALSKLPKHPGATIFRSLELPPPVLRAFLQQYQAGAVVSWSAFTSVAANEGGTFWDRPASNILFEIKNGESYDISDFADGIHYSPTPRTGAELFMPGGIQVKVISVTEEPPGSNRWRIVLEQLPRGGGGGSTNP